MTNSFLIHLLHVLNKFRRKGRLSIIKKEINKLTWGIQDFFFILSLISLFQGFLNYIGVSEIPVHDIPNCFANQTKTPKERSNYPWDRMTAFFFPLVEDKVGNSCLGFFYGHVQWHVYEN